MQYQHRKPLRCYPETMLGTTSKCLGASGGMVAPYSAYFVAVPGAGQDADPAALDALNVNLNVDLMVFPPHKVLLVYSPLMATPKLQIPAMRSRSTAAARLMSK